MEPDGEGECRKNLNEAETKLQRLCKQARAEGSPERLSAVGAMAVRIELELLEDVQARQGVEADRRTPRKAFLRDAGGFLQWTAAGLRVRLGRPIGELMREQD